MAERLFLFLIACLSGVIFNPYILAAADHFTIKGLDSTSIVKTIPIKKPEIKPAPAPLPVTPVSTPAIPANNIQVAGRTLQIVDVADTLTDSGNHVNKYGGQFLYGHNYGAVFGGLFSLGSGSTFTVTYNGVTTNYQVAKAVTFEKNAATGKLQLDGSGDYMLSVSQARSGGVQYGIALMTCAGELYGNGDASHRLVIFANAV